MAGPEPPPFIRPVLLRTSSPPCGEVPLWHFAQFASSTGETESSNGMGFFDWAEAATVQTSDTIPMKKPSIHDRCIPLQPERTIPKSIDSRQYLLAVRAVRLTPRNARQRSISYGLREVM